MFLLKIQQEIDLILNENIINTCKNEWKTKWISAIIEYAQTIKTTAVKKAFKKAEELYQGL